MRSAATIVTLLLAYSFCFAQDTKPAIAGGDFTGMYSFLQDGEYVRINVENGTRLTGFISRRGDAKGPKFVGQFFEKAEIHDHDICFTTRKVDGVWFEFKGAISRGPGKARSAEDYYEIKGTLTRYTSQANQAATAKATEVTFRSLPSEICE